MLVKKMYKKDSFRCILPNNWTIIYLAIIGSVKENTTDAIVTGLLKFD